MEPTLTAGNGSRDNKFIDLLTVKLPVLIILLVLVFLIFARTGESVHGQLTKLGETLWQDYYSLREDPTTPSCDPNLDINTRLDELEAQSGASDDPFADLLESSFDRDAARTSLEAQVKQCSEEHRLAEYYQSQITTGVRVYRSLEHGFSKASIFAASQQPLFLIIVLFVAGCVATHLKHHIAFRPMVSKLDHQISLSLQLVANGSLAVSSWMYKFSTMESDMAISNPIITTFLVIGSTLLTVLTIYQLSTIPKDAPASNNVIRALLSVPLYTIGMLIFASIIIIDRGHLVGLSLYFSAFFENAGTYLDIALYLWCGMLLKQTQLGERVFHVFAPWKLPPEMLALAAIAVMALPTAYTGASSIIILAMGVVVYRELRKVGTRRQLALAATALSGSTGIVLKPCLIVVIIAILNKEVVTDDLFYWGIRVFFVSMLVFFFYAMITKREPLQISPVSEALMPSLSNLKNLGPYVIVFVLMALAYAYFLDAHLDQFSAPVILPVIIIAVMAYERYLSKAEPIHDDPERMPGLRAALNHSMSDASIHIGGLLLMMATFVIMLGIGGKAVAPTFLNDFSNHWAIMAMLMCMFVVIGMFMESMAAVGLVSLTIAPIAYSLGINPIHFWMTCLVALELGYLSPPVALSHIYTRQVVGEEECLAAAEEGDSFYYRHERLLLPLLVMGTTLLIVGFTPLLFAYN